MKTFAAIAIAILVLATSATAQQGNIVADPVLLRAALAVLAQQRNRALDDVAEAQARVGVLTEQLATARQRIQELEAKEKKP